VFGAVSLATAASLVLALARVRLAYAAFVVFALLALPAQAGFRLVRPACEGLVNPALALSSLGNFPHVVLFALFFLLTRRQLSARSESSSAAAWAAGGTVTMGALLELAEGISGLHHCRLRDLLPDAAGAVLGWGVLWAGQASWRAWATRGTAA
jgi:hypothetical protein